jgi:hypothetical protein
VFARPRRQRCSLTRSPSRSRAGRQPCAGSSATGSDNETLACSTATPHASPTAYEASSKRQSLRSFPGLNGLVRGDLRVSITSPASSNALSIASPSLQRRSPFVRFCLTTTPPSPPAPKQQPKLVEVGERYQVPSWHRPCDSPTLIAPFEEYRTICKLKRTTIQGQNLTTVNANNRRPNVIATGHIALQYFEKYYDGFAVFAESMLAGAQVGGPHRRCERRRRGGAAMPVPVRDATVWFCNHFGRPRLCPEPEERSGRNRSRSCPLPGMKSRHGSSSINRLRERYYEHRQDVFGGCGSPNLVEGRLCSRLIT